MGNGSNDGDDELSERGDSMAAEFYRIPPHAHMQEENKKIKGCRRSWARAWTSVAEKERERKGRGGEERGEREETDSNLKLYVRRTNARPLGLCSETASTGLQVEILGKRLGWPGRVDWLARVGLQSQQGIEAGRGN